MGPDGIFYTNNVRTFGVAPAGGKLGPSGKRGPSFRNVFGGLGGAFSCYFSEEKLVLSEDDIFAKVCTSYLLSIDSMISFKRK